MTHSHASNSAKNLIITAVASFIGMLAAVPVSLAIVASAQPVNAMPAQTQGSAVTDANYKQYLQGYTQGYLASVKQDNSSKINVSNCAQTSSETSSSPAAETASSDTYQPMSPTAWSQNVNNSYNTYTSSTKTTNNVSTTINKKQVTNINSNNVVNSNNTATSVVTVKDSTGTVVASGATASGDNVIDVDSSNKNSNNTTTTNTSVNIDDSFNTDSHDKTVVTKIDDSFNHVDATLNKNSHNTSHHEHCHNI